MRRTVLLGSVLLPATLVAAGCASQVPRADGPAGPVTPSASAPATPASSASASAPATPSHSATPTRPSPPTVLGPTGFGALKLGMTTKKAGATGLIGTWKQGIVPWACPLQTHLVGGSGDGALVGYDSTTGVEVIEALPGVSTPEGIHLGSTSAQMLRAYPEWSNAEGGAAHSDGRGYTDVRGDSKATYRIVTLKGKVIELTLQDKNQTCYE